MEYSGKKRYTLCVIIIIRIPGIKRNVSDKNGEIFIMEYREKKFKGAGENGKKSWKKENAAEEKKRRISSAVQRKETEETTEIRIKV